MRARHKESSDALKLDHGKNRKSEGGKAKRSGKTASGCSRRGGSRSTGIRRDRIAQPRVVGLVLGIVALGFCLLFYNPLLSTIGDNAQYVVLGKSLLAGKGLSHINAPDQKPDTKYPFMFPLILAGVILVAPGSIVALKLVGLAACAGAAMLYYALFRRSSEAIVALGAALLAVMSPDILRHSTIILAEVPYLFASIGILAWVSSVEGRWSERRWVPVALVLVVAAYYLKAVGIALAGAIVVSLLFRRKRAWAFAFTGGFILLVLPWFLRVRRIGDGGTYIDYLFMKDPYRPYMGTVSAGELLSRVTGNMGIYFGRIVPESVLPFLGKEGVAPGPALQVLWWIASVLVGLGLVYRLWRRRTIMDVYLLAFLGICVLWPRVWAGVRFVVPVIPLLILCLLTGLWALLGCVTRGRGERVREGGLIGLVAVMSVGFVLVDRVEAARDREYPPDWKSYFEAARWVRSHTDPQSVIICRKPYLFFLASDRRSLGYHFSRDTEEVLSGFEEAGATHVAVDQFFWTGTSAQYLVPTILAHPDRFEVIFATEQEPQTIVVRFLNPETKEGS